jgi:Tat protein translocase TatB subunit
MINMPGGPELMVIVLIALIVLGPQQLPKAMRTMGNVMAEIRKISSGFQTEMRNAMDSITDDAPAKPQSGHMGPVDTSGSETTAPTAASMYEADVTEVVARNDGAEPPSDDVTEPAPSRPAVDPVDRAAG